MEPWTEEQNKLFEQLLAVYDEDTPDRWQHVARGVGKSVEDVKRQYMLLEQDVKHIESGNYFHTLSLHTARGRRSRG